MLLCVTQEKITIKLRKRLGEGAMFSYEDAAKAAGFYSQGAGEGAGEGLGASGGSMAR